MGNPKKKRGDLHETRAALDFVAYGKASPVECCS
jgi:hypothetical protein